VGCFVEEHHNLVLLFSCLQQCVVLGDVLAERGDLGGLRQHIGKNGVQGLDLRQHCLQVAVVLDQVGNGDIRHRG